MGYELKRLSAAGLEVALKRAEHYRALNQPEEAESICRDILDVDPTHHGALRILGLALTDTFPTAWPTAFEPAVAAFKKLGTEYECTYYVGIAWERRAKAQLEQGQAVNARQAFEHALQHFERAEHLAAPGNPEPILHWNRCVRALTTHPDLRNPAVREPAAFQYDD